MISGPPTILIADDYENVSEALASYLRDDGFRVLTALDGTEALRIALESQPVAVVLDVEMPGRTGLEVAHELHQTLGGSRPVLIAMSGRSPEDATTSGLFDIVLSKPLALDALSATLRSVLANRR